MRQIHIIISGRVQGVLFRAGTRDIARQLGLKGFVRNLGNGAVEVVAQGREKELRELAEYCHKGPSAACVDDVDVKYEKAGYRFAGFEVRY